MPLLAWLTACGVEDEAVEPAAAPAVAEADGNAAADSAVFGSVPPREYLPGDRIYYTLTAHEWYARGQPLLHEDRPYRPTGMPVSAALSEMRARGDYLGVDYYVRADDTEPTLYVPVFEGYWQRFRPDTTAQPVN